MNISEYSTQTRASATDPKTIVSVCLMLVPMCAGSVCASSIQGEAHEFEAPPSNRAPLVIDRESGLVPIAALASSAEAEVQQLSALFEHNRNGVWPLQNGFSRQFNPVRVTLDKHVEATELLTPFAGGMLASRDDMLVWSAAVEVAGAYAMRLHLQDVELPADAAIFVGDANGRVDGPFDASLRGPDGDIWLPAVWGSTALLEVQVGANSIREGEQVVFSLGELAEIVDIAGETEIWTDCDIDATCVSSGTLSVISNYQNAVSHLWFMVGGGGFICTGGLVNDTVAGSWIPYLLTANHCFSSQASASSLNAYFDYHSSTCNGAAPPLGTVPRVVGSTLLATNASTDFTFVQLSSNPPGSDYFLGWKTTSPNNGATLHRVSHPAGTAQKYSAGSFLASGGITCNGFPRPNFHYTLPTTGSTTGGSSGAPVIVDAGGGQIVGQLFGTCHFNQWDDCNYGTYNWMDGGFGTTYGSIMGWLDPPQTDIIFIDGFASGNTSAWSSTVN